MFIYFNMATAFLKTFSENGLKLLKNFIISYVYTAARTLVENEKKLEEMGISVTHLLQKQHKKLL